MKRSREHIKEEENGTLFRGRDRDVKPMTLIGDGFSTGN